MALLRAPLACRSQFPIRLYHPGDVPLRSAAHQGHSGAHGRRRWLEGGQDAIRSHRLHAPWDSEGAFHPPVGHLIRPHLFHHYHLHGADLYAALHVVRHLPHRVSSDARLEQRSFGTATARSRCRGWLRRALHLLRESQRRAQWATASSKSSLAPRATPWTRELPEILPLTAARLTSPSPLKGKGRWHSLSNYHVLVCMDRQLQ